LSRGHFTDPVRGRRVAALPEETVRQQVIAHLEGLGYPKYLMRTEVKLEGTTRRLDIVCYCKASEDVVPLLLVECKAAKITPKALSQVVGYNYHLKAPFICLASKNYLECYAAGDLDHQIEVPTYEAACLKRI